MWFSWRCGYNHITKMRKKNENKKLWKVKFKIMLKWHSMYYIIAPLCMWYTWSKEKINIHIIIFLNAARNNNNTQNLKRTFTYFPANAIMVIVPQNFKYKSFTSISIIMLKWKERKKIKEKKWFSTCFFFVMLLIVISHW